MTRKMRNAEGSRMKCAEIFRETCQKGIDNLNELSELIDFRRRNLIQDAMQKSNTSSTNNAFHWYYEGRAKQLSGSYEEALECFDKVKQLNPDLVNYFLCYWRAVCMKGLGMIDEAHKSLDESIGLRPTSESFSFKGHMFAESNQPNKALSCYDEAIRMEPENLRLWLNMGEFFYDQKKYHKSLGCLDEMIRIKPNSLTAWIRKGMILYELEQYGKSLKCFEQAMGLQKMTPKSNSSINGLENWY